MITMWCLHGWASKPYSHNKMRIRLEGLHAWLQLDCLSVSVLHISVVFMCNLSSASLPWNPSQLPRYHLPPHSRAQLWRTSVTTTRQAATVAQVMTTTRQVLTSPSWVCTSAPSLTFLPYSSPTHTWFIWLSLCCSQIWYCRFSAIVCTHAYSYFIPPLQTNKRWGQRLPRVLTFLQTYQEPDLSRTRVSSSRVPKSSPQWP